MRVSGVGPKPCRLMFIGEAPGREEDATGEPFVGKAGSILNAQLNGYSLPLRDDIYLTNLVKERPENNRDPRPEEIARDEPELWAELEEVRPDVIVTLGRVSTRYFLGDVDMEMVHGIPYPPDNINLCALDSPPRTIFPCFHPAAGLHAPELMALFVYDMQRLSAYLKGKLPPRVEDQWAGKEMYQVGLPEPLELGTIVAMDTEGLPGRPWGLSLSDIAGEAYVVKAGQQELIERLREELKQ